MHTIKIDNSEKNAIDMKWSNPGASLYNELCDSSNWEELLQEAYIIAHISSIKNDPRAKTPFTRSGCKYPHHVVRNGKLVLSKSGVKAAYARLKQMGKYHGKAKEHIDEHLKTLGMMDKNGVHYEETIEENFFDIEMYLQEKTGFPFIADFMSDDYFSEASHGALKFDYRYVEAAKDYPDRGIKKGNTLICIYELKGIKISYSGHFHDNEFDIKKIDHKKMDKINTETQKNIAKKGNIDHQSYGQRLIAIKHTNANGKSINQWTAEKNPGMEFEVYGAYVSSKARSFTIKLGEVESFENRTFKSTKLFTNLNPNENNPKYDVYKLLMSSGSNPAIRGSEDDNQTYIRMTKFFSSTNAILNSNIAKEMDYYIDRVENKIKHLTFSKDINGIKSYQFINQMNRWDKLESIIIPESIKSIQSYAFFGCNSLKDVKILGTPNIDPNAFYKCHNLSEESKKRILELQPKAVFESSEDIYDDSLDYLEEKYTPLKFDYRKVYDINTGHMLKLVYSLDNIHIVFPGKSYGDDDHGYDPNTPKHQADRKHAEENIRKNGNGDHSSWGQKLLAIVDVVDNKRLQSADVIGPYNNGISSRFVDLSNGGNLEWVQNKYKGTSKVATVKVGEIEDSKHPTFKSTHWFNNVALPMEIDDGIFTKKKILDNTTTRMNVAEAIRNLRSPAKINDINGAYTPGKSGDAIKYNHPSKKDIRNNPDLYKEFIQESMDWISQFVHDEEFRENVAVISNIQSPQSLMKWIKNVTPAYASKKDQFYHDIKDSNFDPKSASSLQPPKDIARSKKGSVFDKVELERYWFDQHGYRYAVLCLVLETEPGNIIMHPFVVYQIKKAIFWFENSLPDINGSIQFRSLTDLVMRVIKYVKKVNETDTKRASLWYLTDPPAYGINTNEYLKYVQTQVELPLNNLPKLIFNESYEFDFGDMFSESVEYFEEKSHGKLKYCYRIGFDVATGEQVAIEFELDPNAITAVSDTKLVEQAKSKISASGKQVPDISYNDMNQAAVEELKSNIRKYGHIDFVTSELMVHAIFTKSKKRLDKVDIVPLFSDIVNKSIAGLYKSGVKKQGVDTVADVIKSQEFIQLLLNKIKYLKYKPESYEVGKQGGNDKYKSTKLMWDIDMMLSYRYTPMLRGINAEGRDVEDSEDAINFIMNDLNNKFKKRKHFEEESILYTPLDDLVMEYSSWGTGYYNINFIGGESTYNPDDPLSFDLLSIEDIYMGRMYNRPISEECVIMDSCSDEYIEGIRKEYEMMRYFEEQANMLDYPLYEAEETTSTEESMPKQTDKKESDKNGVNRKKLYIAFIEWSKTFSDKNAFGSMFDKDAFHVTYPFVPEPMRYFYRISNPLMCILSGNLTFFPLSELRKINEKNSQLANMMIFAATENDMRVFNAKDNAVYMATDENGTIKLGNKLADSFDLYIQTMINRGDILNGADPDKVPDAPPELDNTEEAPEENNETEDIMDEPIEDTQEVSDKKPEDSDDIPPVLEDNEESK